MADSAARMEALGLSEDDVANFKEAFATYDTESTGIINAAALASIMAALGFQNVSRDDVDGAVGEVIMDGSDEINFPKFLEMMAFHKNLNDTVGISEDDEARAVFEMLASGGDAIPQDRLVELITSLTGDELTEEDIEDLMAEADPDSTGAVSFEHFRAVMLSR